MFLIATKTVVQFSAKVCTVEMVVCKINLHFRYHDIMRASSEEFSKMNLYCNWQCFEKVKNCYMSKLIYIVWHLQLSITTIIYDYLIRLIIITLESVNKNRLYSRDNKKNPGASINLYMSVIFLFLSISPFLRLFFPSFAFKNFFPSSPSSIHSSYFMIGWWFR